MPIVVESVGTAQGERKQQPDLPDDDYLATFVGYVNIGAISETFKDQPKEVNRVYCVFELDGQVDAFGKPRLLSKKLNLSLANLSTFRKFWQSVVNDMPDCVAGKSYVETAVQNKYLGEFDRYLGLQLRLIIKNDDGGYPTIESAMKLKPSQKAWENKIEPFFFDLKVKDSLKYYPLLPSICRKDLAKSKVGLEQIELIAKLEARLKEVYAAQNAEREANQPKEEPVSDVLMKAAQQSIAARAKEEVPQSDDLPF